MVSPMQPFGQHEHARSDGIAQHSPRRLIDPVLVNRILDEEADADDEHDDADLTEKVLTDELLIVRSLSGENRFFPVTCRIFFG